MWLSNKLSKRYAVLSIYAFVFCYQHLLHLDTTETAATKLTCKNVIIPHGIFKLQSKAVCYNIPFWCGMHIGLQTYTRRVNLIPSTMSGVHTRDKCGSVILMDCVIQT